MESWNQYIFSIIGSTLVCGAVVNLISDSSHKQLCQWICSMTVAITALQPLSGVDLNPILDWKLLEQVTADPYTSMGEEAGKNEQARYIKEACETYILSKADALGMAVSVETVLSEEMVPAFVEIYVEAGQERQADLESILETHLGITKENQIWIWNHEGNSS